MTDERKNEIWAMLDESSKRYMRRQHQTKEVADEFSQAFGYGIALEDIFGIHNLTAKAEVQPKEEQKGNNEDISKNLPIDYALYRLDLAKEFAVAMLTIKKIDWDDIASDSVFLANEIVKRLKETEE